MIGVLKFVDNDWFVENEDGLYPLHPYNKLFTDEKNKQEQEVEFSVRRDCYSGCGNTCYHCVHFKDYAILK